MRNFDEAGKGISQKNPQYSGVKWDLKTTQNTSFSSLFQLLFLFQQKKAEKNLFHEKNGIQKIFFIENQIITNPVSGTYSKHESVDFQRILL